MIRVRGILLESYQIVSLENLDTSLHLKNIIYGRASDIDYDGIHLQGPAASRHYSYQVVKMIQSYFPTDFPIKKSKFRIQPTPNRNLFSSFLPHIPVNNVKFPLPTQASYAVPTFN